MAVVQPPPYPRAAIGTVGKDPLTGQPVATVTKPWGIYFRDQRQYLAQIPVNVSPTALMVLAENASVGATTILTPDQEGLYGFEYYVRVVTAAATSSSVQVTLGWSDGGVTQSQAFTAVTGNTTASQGSGRYLFRSDGGAPITYTVTYASNGAGEMEYSLYMVTQSVASVTVT